MCYEVKCSNCGKSTWGGCGRHVKLVYDQIPEGQHCLCRDWPGVKSGGDAAGSGDEKRKGGYCSILPSSAAGRSFQTDW
ncbi:hypothetical protein MLD38_001728 [Melastoma candidum]|uniref:Uncharacterized protein n=1 Tax=Melastoma candidum TaxID=119954 RepID=A0ACB9SJ25_9MYRT|nr:hypothetical protein MLD38_001728 [Melastoma candidum]